MNSQIDRDAHSARLERIVSTALNARNGAELTVTEQRELAEAFCALRDEAAESTGLVDPDTHAELRAEIDRLREWGEANLADADQARGYAQRLRDVVGVSADVVAEMRNVLVAIYQDYDAREVPESLGVSCTHAWRLGKRLAAEPPTPVRSGSLWEPRDPNAKNPLDAIDTSALPTARERVVARADAAGPPPGTGLLAGSPDAVVAFEQVRQCTAESIQGSSCMQVRHTPITFTIAGVQHCERWFIRFEDTTTAYACTACIAAQPLVK